RRASVRKRDTAAVRYWAPPLVRVLGLPPPSALPPPLARVRSFTLPCTMSSGVRYGLRESARSGDSVTWARGLFTGRGTREAYTQPELGAPCGGQSPA